MRELKKLRIAFHLFIEILKSDQYFVFVRNRRYKYRKGKIDLNVLADEVIEILYEDVAEKTILKEARSIINKNPKNQ